MSIALYVAATGMNVQQSIIDSKANNVANINTTAFKADMISAGDLEYQRKKMVGAVNSDSGTTTATQIQFGLGANVKGTQKSFEQGPLESTPGQSLNLALDGIGFFQITMPDGSTAYTRDGSFQRSSTGEIVTSDGNPLVPGFVIPDGLVELTITKDGQIQGILNKVATNLGQIELVRFLSPGALKPIGNNMYVETDGSGAPIAGLPNADGFSGINQYFLEGSNVDPVRELVELVKAQRAFDMNSKMMRAAEETLKEATNAKV